ncbi:MAG TPA: hypothetical protein VF657_11905 [Actinoplanes sp.]|jgi:hypothetical protein
MFPYNDPQTMLELQHQHVTQLRNEAVAFRLARSASAAGRHRNAGWWARLTHRPHSVRAPVVG